jgi:hypothetical protein
MTSSAVSNVSVVNEDDQYRHSAPRCMIYNLTDLFTYNSASGTFPAGAAYPNPGTLSTPLT